MHSRPSFTLLALVFAALPARGTDFFWTAPLAPPPADSIVKRVRLVQMAPDALDARPGRRLLGLTLNLFDDLTLTARPTALEQSDIGLHLMGQIDERPHGTFALSIIGDEIVGDIVLSAEDEVYRLRPTGDGLIRVEQLDLRAILPCGQRSLPPDPAPATPPVDVSESDNPAALGVAPPVVDVMVVYTPSARTYWGGTAATLATIRTWVLSTNQYYVNSNVNARIRLVYLGEVAYTESGSSSSDLSFLTNFDDTIDEVHALRGQHGADMVVMLTNVTDVCGIGWLFNGSSERAFSITSVRCLSLTFAHELGHNFGCCHDRDNAGGGCYNSQSFGYRYTGQSGTLWRTIMAYAPGTRIGYFSNPNVSYDGAPTGTNSEYNARTIGLTAPTVRAYRTAPLYNDCDQNLIVDDLDILAGAATDANGNGVLDVCDNTYSGWNPRFTAPGDPPARSRHAIAYDSARGVAVLFGGQSGANLGDTWEWSPADGWQQRGGGPSPRQGHGLAFDDDRNRTVLFGGFDSTYSGQTWEWDGAAWTQSPAVGPSPRRDAPLAFDSARDRVVLFGGFNGANLDDTWAFDGSSWSLQNTPSPRPSARRGHAMTFDSTRNVVLLFGGTNGSQVLGDLWQWNGTQWSLLAPGGGPNSPAAAFATLVFDDRRGVAILYGGSTSSGLSAQTWEWNGTSWSLRSSGTPAARTESAATYVADRGITLLFGGSAGGSPLGDTWELRRREPEITQQPVGLRVCEGSGFTLSISATSGIAYPLSYQWFKDGFPLLGGDGPVYATGFSGPATPGYYSCQVSNLYGSVTSDEVRVELDHPVQITLVSPFGGQSLCAGSPAVFTVTATGSSQLQYQWRKGSTDILGATAPSFTIPAAALTDTGLYRVRVSSECGSQLSPAIPLTVRPCGDANCDGSVNVLDINAFVLAIQDAVGYEQQYPNCPIENSDMNSDDVVDVLDINLFVARLLGN